MASAWGNSWARAWGNSWGSTQAVVIYGGDDAPRTRRARKEQYDLFQDMERTVHRLLHPEPEAAPVAQIDTDAARRAVDELVVLAQGQHALLQRVAAIRAELQAYEAQRQAMLEQDEEDALIWMF